MTSPRLPLLHKSQRDDLNTIWLKAKFLALNYQPPLPVNFCLLKWSGSSPLMMRHWDMLPIIHCQKWAVVTCPRQHNDCVAWGRTTPRSSGIVVHVWFCFKFSLVLGLPSIPSALESFEEMSVSVILSMASSTSPPQFLRPQKDPRNSSWSGSWGPHRTYEDQHSPSYPFLLSK